MVKEPDDYYITVKKQAYIYPSKFLGRQKMDGEYVDLYHQEKIKVKEGGDILTVNIPIDPAEKIKVDNQKALLKYLKNKLQVAVSYLGIFLSVASFLIYSSVLIGLFIVMHILLFYVFRRFGIAKRPKSWGIVYDQKSKKPVINSIVRIFDNKYNKLLETQATDLRGRYSFLVGKNVYNLSVGKNGYKDKTVKPVNIKDEVISVDVPLQKSK